MASRVADSSQAREARGKPALPSIIFPIRTYCKRIYICGKTTVSGREWRRENREAHLIFVVFGSWQHRFTLFLLLLAVCIVFYLIMFFGQVHLLTCTSSDRWQNK